MTPLARTIITTGVILFTLGTLLWITTGSWQWVAGGGAIFFGTILAGGILSVEVKNPPRHNYHDQTYQEPQTQTQPQPYQEPRTQVLDTDHDPFSS